MVASWSISEEKYPQKNQGTAGLEPATFSFNCHLQARLTSAAPNVLWDTKISEVAFSPRTDLCTLKMPPCVLEKLNAARVAWRRGHRVRLRGSNPARVYIRSLGKTLHCGFANWHNFPYLCDLKCEKLKATAPPKNVFYKLSALCDFFLPRDTLCMKTKN
jgi:hypothetical protein